MTTLAASAMLWLICAATSLASAPARTSSASAAWRLAAIDLEVNLDFADEKLSGSVGLEVENVSSEPASTLSLLLGRLMRFDRVSLPEGANVPFEQEVVTFVDSPKEQVNHALLHLPGAVPPGGRTAVHVAYSGFLVGYTETGSLYIQDRIDPEFTILRVDAYAFPVVGVPSREGNKAIPMSDFPFQVRVTVPKGLTVANGGELVGRDEHGDRVTWRYRSLAPAPFLNVTIAPYELTEADGIRLFAFPKDHEGAIRVRKAARDALALYERWFGPTATPPRFALIEIPRDWGSQASLAGGVIQTASTFQDPGGMIELYHEISHFWNVPDREPQSPRWNEGLASYLQYRVAEELEGRKDLDEVLEARVTRLRERLPGTPRLAEVPFADYGKAGMTDESYPVGRLMFAVLEKAVGPDGFRRIVGGFYQRYKTTGATTRDFIAFAGQTGGAPVAALLGEWMTSTRWVSRLSTGQSLTEIAASYRGIPPKRP